MSTICIGIDLGTTNTCVACYENDRVRILDNEEGGRVTPSYVYITEKDEIFVGSFAKNMADRKAEYGIYDVKRLIGRKFDDPQVQNNLKYFPFTITNVNNDPVVMIKRKNDQFMATPIQLCTAILKKIKKDADAKLGEPVNQAVITVPAYFNNSQREATMSAANKAGLAVLRLLNEPTAAALNYYHLKYDENYSLVYDLGGGTFDVAILKRSGNKINIIGVNGNAHLGGNDFDNLIIDYVCDYVNKNYKYDLKSDPRDLRRLRNRCEEAKKLLSLTEETSILLDGFLRDYPTIEVGLTRARFEEMAKKLFRTTIDILDGCLKNCKVAKADIKEVILSGGSTRIPKIQNMISEYFDGKTLNKILNPDECVAKGAAIQAAMLSTNKNQKIETFKITDVTPLSLGTNSLGDLMTFVVKRNTSIPASASLIYKTIYNRQTSMSFDVYEGERTNARKNRFLGAFTIKNLTPAPPRQCGVLVTMSIDKNGILQVKAEDKLRNKRRNVKEVTIAYQRDHRSDNEVQNALKDAEDNKEEDQRFVKFADLKSFIVEYCETVKYNLENQNLKVFHKELFDLCEETENLAWGINLDIEKKLKKLKVKVTKACDDVAYQYNFKFMPTHYK